ncbi:FGGY-family carbohydrate kinase [Photobacterium lipolyticum]|uniref:Carbohydrate kinase n=1 Tax=Photobacterium lipolyticum TaxID=266810 RepID=A0A2T3N475_9GAMM|nr:FGGY-family carbohydrate kinase [Photobacterium lipolyticum]PSW07230.1 carbohydrate kinase [Photobacterium lipolyticum]
MTINNNSEWLLVIDNGTQSVRALVFDLQGQLIAKSKIKLTPYVSPQPGRCEQDGNYYWQKLCEACQLLWQQGIDKSRIKAMSVTTQRGTMLPLDADGEPLRPAILWLDQRKYRPNTGMGWFWDNSFKLLGLTETIDTFRQKAQPNWIYQAEREIWDKTHKFTFLSGFFHHRLTGEWADSSGSQVGYLPFDYKKHKWASDLDWKWRALHIKPEQLLQLVKPGTRIGQVTAQAAEQTGIPEDLPVIAAAADKACEVLGSGGQSSEIGCLSFGTTATINVTMSKYVEAVRFLPPYPSAIAGSYCSEVMLYRGFWMVSWFKDQFAHLEQIKAEQTGVEAESLFDELVNSVPPGSMGLMLQPYWGPGVKQPGPEAKGAVIGFGDVHTRAHLYRAILEGLAFGLREGLEAIEKRSGYKISELRVSGGGSQSDAAMQIAADIFGLPAFRPHTYETSGLGAAIDAAVGIGLHDSFTEAVQAMVHKGQCFEPNPTHHQMYDKLYNQVYLDIYKKLQPLYAKIREITCYPE